MPDPTPHPRTVPPLLVAAAGSYVANCALGGAVALRLLDTSGYRWLHHVVFTATATLTALAAADLVRRRDVGRFLRLAPVAVPLALVPRVSARTRGHVLVAASMAPAYLAALVPPRRPGRW